MQIYDILVATAIAVAYKLPIINATRELHIKQVVKGQITAVRRLQSWHFERTVWPFANEQRANADEGLTLKNQLCNLFCNDNLTLINSLNYFSIDEPVKVKNQTQLW